MKYELPFESCSLRALKMSALVRFFLIIFFIIPKNVETIENGIPSYYKPYGELIYMISLWYEEDYICSASAITMKHVLTAAHCVHGRDKSRLLARAGSDIECLLPDHQPSCFDIINKFLITDRSIKEVYIHPHYKSKIEVIRENQDKCHAENDIAILGLTRSFPNNEMVEPIWLPNRDLSRECMTFVCAGWGKTDLSGPNIPSPQLLYIFMERLEPERCGVRVRDNEFCARHVENDAFLAPGDSGAPIVCRKTAVGVMGTASALSPALFYNVWNSISFIYDVLAVPQDVEIMRKRKK